MATPPQLLLATGSGWSGRAIASRGRVAVKAFSRRHPGWPARAAAAWSAGYGLLGLSWALGAGGFPFGVGDPEGRDMTSLLVGVRPEATGTVIAGLGAAGVAVSLLTLRPLPRGAARSALLAFSWLVAVVLIFLVPDVRLMRDFAYAFVLNFDKLDWPAINQMVCAAGGVLWALTALALHRPAATRADRDAAWRRWGARATVAAVLLPVPYEIIRWAWAFGIPLGVSEGAATIEDAGAQARLGMFVLGLLPFVGGVLTHGLARPWGEIYPRWVPGKAGRPIHPLVAIVPATTAAIMIITAGLIIYREAINVQLVRVPEAQPDVTGWGAWLPAWFWLPWGVALAVATYAYHRRRAALRDEACDGKERAAPESG
jgi:hypothetical protein